MDSLRAIVLRVGEAMGVGSFGAVAPISAVSRSASTIVGGVADRDFRMRVARVGSLPSFAVYCGVLGVVLLAMGRLR